MRGPIVAIKISASMSDAHDDDFADGAYVDIDDVSEEASSFPEMDEATKNIITGEADQVSVKTSFTIAFNKRANTAITILDDTLPGRVWVGFEDADGKTVIYGGNLGMKVRRLDNHKLGYGEQSLVIFKFERTGRRSTDLFVYRPEV